MKQIKKFFKLRESSLLLVLIVFLLCAIFLEHNFLTRINLVSILNYLAENFILIGMLTIILISGCFDLSVGTVAGFSSILAGILMVKANLPILVAILLTLLIAALIGAFNGYFIAYVGFNPFVATLISWLLLLSAKYAINNGEHVYNLPKNFQKIAQTKFLNISMMVYFAIFCLLVFGYLLSKNAYFRQNYYIGGNEKASLLAGIKVRKVKFVNYVLIAIMASIAGMFTASRLGASYTTTGDDTSFILTIGAIIGGVSLYGGTGSIFGSILGLVFMALFYDTIVIFGINLYWNKVVLGFIILIVVALDTVIEGRKRTIAGWLK